MMKQIGTIHNYYGGLDVKYEDEKFYWCIPDHSSETWEEITLELYSALLKFEEDRCR